MSNVINVQYTKFQNVDKNGKKVGKPTFGYTVADNYASYSNNACGSLDDVKKEINEDNMLEVIEGIEGFEGASTGCTGIVFNGKFFYIEDLLNEEKEYLEVVDEKDHKNGLYGEEL